MAKRPPQPGDVFSIAVDGRYGLIVCGNQYAGHGYLCRVYHDLRNSLPVPITASDLGESYFEVLFPLAEAHRLQQVAYQGHVELPELLKPRVFRWLTPDLKSGRGFVGWALWDGERTWDVEAIAPEQWRLPIKEVVNTEEIRGRLREHWEPERDARIFLPFVRGD